ncbi:hypothetical protein C5O23_04010 [Duncaniella muris]|uniref:Uncharacterized protein n=1 Tax=Duncaniella muris TaxID=2094150 RepID=A0A2V1IQB7_9BACT|nr:hypothetical protein C5O23_04010 [Duncaniella muris]
MAGKHQKMYFSFFKIALFVLPIINMLKIIRNYRLMTAAKHWKRLNGLIGIMIRRKPRLRFQKSFM